MYYTYLWLVITHACETRLLVKDNRLIAFERKVSRAMYEPNFNVRNANIRKKKQQNYKEYNLPNIRFIKTEWLEWFGCAWSLDGRLIKIESVNKINKTRPEIRCIDVIIKDGPKRVFIDNVSERWWSVKWWRNGYRLNSINARLQQKQIIYPSSYTSPFFWCIHVFRLLAGCVYHPYHHYVKQVNIYRGVILWLSNNFIFLFTYYIINEFVIHVYAYTTGINT